MAPATLEWTFSDRFRKLRKATGMRQAEFADRIGEKSGTISAWEAGGQPRRLIDTAQHIEDVFEIPGLAAWLLGVGPTPSVTVGYPMGNLAHALAA